MFLLFLGLLLPLLWLFRVSCAASSPSARLTPFVLGALLSLLAVSPAQAQGGNTAPTVVTSTPFSITTFPGATRIITVRYRDLDGATDLEAGWVMVNENVSWAGSLTVVYSAGSNLLYMRNDDGSDWIGGYAPGSANMLSNSQGTIDCAQTTVVKQGTDVIINWCLTAKNGLIGQNHIFAYGNDLQYQASGWVDVGTWDVNAPPPPTIVAPSPLIALATRTGEERIVSVTYRDALGHGELESGWLLINSVVSWDGSICGIYVAQTNEVYLRNDDGSDWVGHMTVGSAGTLSNSSGSISMARTTVVKSGTDLTINWAITPKSLSLAANGVWGYTNTPSGQASGYTSVGTWNIGLGAPGTLSAQGTGDGIALSWTPVEGATGYQIFRASSSGAYSTTPVATVTATNWTDTDAVAGVTNFYKVRAVLGTTNGADSNEASAARLYSLDARIRNSGVTTWTGENIINQSAQNQEVTQSVEAGETATYFVSVKRNGASSGQSIRLTAEGAGQDTTFLQVTAEGAGGLDITPAITGTTGWVAPALAPGQEVIVRVVVPAANSAQSILIKATDDASPTPLVDAVKASLGIVASYQPDVSLERLDSQGNSEAAVGVDVLNNDVQQTLGSVLAPGGTHTYLAHIKNTSQNPTTFRVSLGGLLSSTGAATPWSPTGWTATAQVGTSDILSQMQIASGWETPSLNKGEETVVKLTFTAPTSPVAMPMGSFRLAAFKGAKHDAVIGSLSPQAIDHLEWSRDGQTWSQAPLTAEQNEVIAFRAVPTDPSISWDALGFKPEWTEQGDAHWGESVWIHFPAVGQVSILAQSGNQKTVTVQVVDPA